MGFDLNIRAELLICSDTGKPYYYTDDTRSSRAMRIYDLSKLTVPKEYRRFLNQRGGIFHAYTTCVFDDDTITVSIADFLEKYPSWEMVKIYDEDCAYWTEADHIEFKKALDWFNNDCIQYQIHWSY